MISLNLETPPFAEIRAERAEKLRASEERRAKRLQRSYDAARVNRLNLDWAVVNTSANFELRKSLRVLRARARNLARNDPYAKKFLKMVRDNVSGPVGIRMQPRALDPRGEPDEALNKKVSDAWREWSHRENASASGKLSWRDIQRKADTMLARDGESLVRALDPGNKFGFALRCYSADWLDETFNERLNNGNRVIMSVEIDDFDRPVAYWLTPPPADYQFLDSGVRVRTRVPAGEIIHMFLLDDENADDDSQTRGTPWMHAVMERAKMLGGYEDAEVTAARVGASKMGFFKRTASDEDSYEGDEEDSGGEDMLMDSAQPGTFGVIPEGYEFEKWEPSHPNTNYGAFMKTALQGFAAGLDVEYFTLSGDLEAVNYSTARVGLLSERDGWRGLQQFKIEHFNRRVYLMWLRAALLSGALDVKASDYKRLLAPAWHARGWAWIDPAKESQASVTEINNVLDTVTDTLAEQGRDIEEVVATRKRELKLLADADIPTAPMGGAQAGEKQAEGDAGETAKS